VVSTSATGLLSRTWQVAVPLARRNVCRASAGAILIRVSAAVLKIMGCTKSPHHSHRPLRAFHGRLMTHITAIQIKALTISRIQNTVQQVSCRWRPAKRLVLAPQTAQVLCMKERPTNVIAALTLKLRNVINNWAILYTLGQLQCQLHQLHRQHHQHRRHPQAQSLLELLWSIQCPSKPGDLRKRTSRLLWR
jgi:hypothetical protein